MFYNNYVTDLHNIYITVISGDLGGLFTFSCSDTELEHVILLSTSVDVQLKSEVGLASIGKVKCGRRRGSSESYDDKTNFTFCRSIYFEALPYPVAITCKK